MASKESERLLRQLSLSVGDFIRYWGFRRVHGSIWTQLYLSPRPLSCTELAHRLQFSKALISPALAELESYKLIRQVDSGDDKTVLYEAAPDVNAVIQQVLKKRERPLLQKVKKNFDDFAKHSEGDSEIRTERMEELQNMISAAQMMLELMLTDGDLTALPTKIER